MDFQKLEQILKSTFECNFQEDALHELQKRKTLFGKYMNVCKQTSLMKINARCYSTRFHTEMCLKSNLRLIKTVRLKMEHIGFLMDQYKSLKVLLLMRDPRSILSSRLSNSWCGKKPDCENVSVLCQEMDQDLIHAQKYSQMYPKRVQIVKYEDINQDPFEYILHLFNTFIQAPITEDFKMDLAYFLKIHSNIKVENVSINHGRIFQYHMDLNPMAKRDKSALDERHWSKVFNESFVNQIQQKCFSVLKELNYI